MAKQKADSGIMTSHRKAADYLLRALQESDSSDTGAVRKLVYLAQSELDATAGEATRREDYMPASPAPKSKKL